MKLKLNLTRTADIVFIAIVFIPLVLCVAFFYYTTKMSTPTKSNVDKAMVAEIKKDTDSVFRNDPNDFDSSYSFYKNKIQKIEFERDQYLKPIHLRYSVMFYDIGLEEYSDCDTCKVSKHGIILNNYKSTDAYPNNPFTWETYYYGYKGHYYKKYLSRDTSSKKGTIIINWTKEEIQYMVQDEPYAIKDGSSEGKKQILVPVSKTQKEIFQIMYWIGIVLCLFVTVLILRNVLQILLHIAAGKAFSNANTKRLFFIAGGICIIPTIEMIQKLIVYLMIKKQLNGDWVPSYKNFDIGKYVIVGIVVFLIAKAFERGYKIQQEQDLTI
jgi:hypothetical protein